MPACFPRVRRQNLILSLVRLTYFAVENKIVYEADTTEVRFQAYRITASFTQLHYKA